MAGYSVEINFGMLFRRMYCSRCGTKLKRQSYSSEHRKGELGYEKHFRPRISVSSLETQIIVRYDYVCPYCKRVTTYEQQCLIAKKQKKAKTRILDSKE